MSRAHHIGAAPPQAAMVVRGTSNIPRIPPRTAAIPPNRTRPCRFRPARSRRFTALSAAPFRHPLQEPGDPTEDERHSRHPYRNGASRARSTRRMLLHSPGAIASNFTRLIAFLSRHSFCPIVRAPTATRKPPSDQTRRPSGRLPRSSTTPTVVPSDRPVTPPTKLRARRITVLSYTPTVLSRLRFSSVSPSGTLPIGRNREPRPPLEASRTRGGRRGRRW
jgi:hypothetical protein